MSESSKILGESTNGYRSRIERVKSMKDIMDQFSRIDNRLYRAYINYEMDEDEFQKRRQRIRDAYDRYEVNMANNQGFNITQHGEGAGNSYTYYLHKMNLNKKAPKSVYAKK